MPPCLLGHPSPLRGMGRGKGHCLTFPPWGHRVMQAPGTPLMRGGLFAASECAIHCGLVPDSGRGGAMHIPPGRASSCSPGNVAVGRNLGLGRPLVPRSGPAEQALKPLLMLGLLVGGDRPPRPLGHPSWASRGGGAGEVGLCLPLPWSHRVMRAPGTPLMRGGPSAAPRARATGALRPAVPGRRTRGAAAKGLKPYCACCRCVDARGAVREAWTSSVQ